MNVLHFPLNPMQIFSIHNILCKELYSWAHTVQRTTSLCLSEQN